MLTYDTQGNQLKGLKRVLPALYNARCEDANLVSGVLLPSGKVRCGVVPPKVVPSGDREYERNCSGYEYDFADWKDECKRRHLVGMLREKTASPLGLAAVPNCHKPEPKRYGLKGISARGRESVKEGAWLLEKRYGRRLGFYTLTCPYTEPEDIYLYNQHINYIQKAYFQELKREYKRKGVTWSYVSCIEIQPKRFAATGIPVLHIHYIAPCFIQGTREWVCTADALRRIWGRVLANTLGYAASTKAAIDAATIKSSAIGYIAKYLSKGGEEVDFLAVNCPDQLPSQWWSMSSNVRQAIKNNTVVLPAPIAHYLFFKPETDPDELLHLLYRTEVHIPWNGIDLHVGFSAQMNPKGDLCLRDGCYWLGNL